ncbi:MAG: hypothetical protein K0R26_1343 [Bacteroidota bacterium]|jgi:cytochrome c1|nr:hypothetical protein [Bacteroidota bacterium]
MTTLKITSLAAAILVIAACHSKKKTTADTASAPVKSTTGIFVPGEEELTAIKVKFPDATHEKLSEGHAIYTGVCTKCHGAKSIYRISEDKWQPIIDDMAKKAKITDSQKDALTKFVFSVKATQPK